MMAEDETGLLNAYGSRTGLWLWTRWSFDIFVDFTSNHRKPGSYPFQGDQYIALTLTLKS